MYRQIKSCKKDYKFRVSKYRFFQDDDIFENVDIKIKYSAECSSRQLSFLQTFEGITNNININGSAQAIVGNKNTIGSTIDIKTVYKKFRYRRKYYKRNA